MPGEIDEGFMMGVRISEEEARRLGIDVGKGKKAKLPKEARPAMNGTESRYADCLESMKLGGVIKDWMFDSIKLRLADKTWYKADFLVWMNDGSVQIHEVKGFMRDDAAVKIKVAAENYRMYRFFVIRLTSGQFVSEPVEPRNMG